MPPELTGTALEILLLSIAFAVALFLPLVVQLALLYVAGWAFIKAVSRVSRTVVSWLGLIGAPVHELSHALACLFTLSSVRAVKLLSDGVGPGFVIPKRPNFLTNIVAGLAPLFGGTLVLWLTAVYIIPGFQVPATPPPQLNLESATAPGTVLNASLAYVAQLAQTAFRSLPYLQGGNWRTYLGLFIAFSVALGLAPSPNDLRGLAAGLPVAIVFGLAGFVLLYLSGNVAPAFATLQQKLLPQLLGFSTAVTYAFLLTSLGTLIFMPLALLLKLRGG
jgi:hypothetical protein